MRENPVIADWVPSSGGSTEGLLGGWLAQRQAALRGKLAAGALLTFTLVSRACRLSLRAPRVPQKTFRGISEGLDVMRSPATQIFMAGLMTTISHSPLNDEIISA